MAVRIVTDSGCDLPAGSESEIKIKIVPLLFRFGLEEYPDKSMSMREFLLRIEKTFPTTSAPSPGDYIKAFRDCIKDDDQVICFTISGKHSASFSSAILASQNFPPGLVTVVDSVSLSIGQGLQVLMAAQAAQRGESPKEIIAKVKDLQHRSHLYIGLDTVQNLVKGGRANQLVGILAGLLKIRPILTLVDGQLTLLDRPRGRMASKQRLLELAAGCFPFESATVGHIGCEDEARETATALALRTGFPEKNIPVLETGMALAVHGGPGTLGIVVVSSKPG